MSADALLAIVAGRDVSSLLEVRCRSPLSGRIEAREWFPVDAHNRTRRYIVAQAERLDVYVGAAPRTRRAGGKGDVARAWCLWVDCDEAASVERLRAFSPRPSLVVHSGTGDNVHAYWALTESIPPAWLERANRRLAHALGADMKATDCARILRPPGTLNFKHDPPVPVTIEYLKEGSVAVPVFHIVGGLPDPPNGRPVRAPRPNVNAIDDPLLGVSSDNYYTHLTGREVTRGNVQCPFHGDGMERNPSMRLYPDGTWYCFVCCEGGSVYQMAAHVWGYPLPLRGEIFKEVRDRLIRELL